MNWVEYEQAAADFFRALSMDARMNVSLEGARATHAIDVVVRFSRYGVGHFWIVECKHWNRRVPKERVLLLQQIATDVGADRAFLVSARGFQSGAATAARFSNVTLTGLEDLRANAEADLQLARWGDLYERLAKL